jgi:carbon-monoxide dehydrogenase medium subunit
MVMEKYFVPKTMEEACSLLSSHKVEAAVVAGGTDLIVCMKKGIALPRYVISIGSIAGQDYINYDERKGLRIGGQAPILSLATSPVIRAKYGVLAQAAGELGTPHVRRGATLAGNLCNASPSAETAPALIVLGASLKLVSTERERTVPLEDFFVGPGQTVRAPDEILAEIRVPNLAPRSGGVYLKHTVRKALDLAIVGVAVMVTMEGDSLHDVKIALGAVAPTPLRAKAAEAVLKGKKATDSLLQQAGQVAADVSRPIDDIRSSAEYRRKMVKVLTIRAIQQAIGQVK